MKNENCDGGEGFRIQKMTSNKERLLKRLMKKVLEIGLQLRITFLVIQSILDSHEVLQCRKRALTKCPTYNEYDSRFLIMCLDKLAPTYKKTARWFVAKT